MSEKRTGKTIVSIKPKKGQVAVSFDDESVLLFTENAYTDLTLYVGKTVTSEEYGKLAKIAKDDDFYDIALRMVAKQPRSVHEVWAKLEAKGAEEETIRTVVAQLKDQGLLNDELFARTYYLDIADIRILGKQKVRFDLFLKGIPASIINDLPYDDELELQRASRLAATLNRKEAKTPSIKKKAKLIKALVDRGFDVHIAVEAVEKEFTPMDPEAERNALKRDFVLANAKYNKKFSGYELKKRVYAYLLKHGYTYDEINSVMEVPDENY